MCVGGGGSPIAMEDERPNWRRLQDTLATVLYFQDDRHENRLKMVIFWTLNWPQTGLHGSKSHKFGAGDAHLLRGGFEPRYPQKDSGYDYDSSLLQEDALYPTVHKVCSRHIVIVPYPAPPPQKTSTRSIHRICHC